MQDVRIRPYTPADRETLAEIADMAWSGIFESYHKFLGEELFDILIEKPETRKGDEMRRICDERPENVWVCDVDGRIAGFVTFVLDEGSQVGLIGNNALHPEFTGRGLAQVMYHAVLDHFRELGLPYAGVQTGLDEGHAAARRSYERLGFDIRRESVIYYMKL